MKTEWSAERMRNAYGLGIGFDSWHYADHKGKSVFEHGTAFSMRLTLLVWQFRLNLYFKEPS